MPCHVSLVYFFQMEVLDDTKSGPINAERAQKTFILVNIVPAIAVPNNSMKEDNDNNGHIDADGTFSRIDEVSNLDRTCTLSSIKRK